MPPVPDLTDTLARRVVERSAAERQAKLAEEMSRIVEATYDLVERTGNLDPSIREILAHTGLSTQSFYRYFRSKDELMLAMLHDGRRRLVQYLAHQMEKVPKPEDKVRAWIQGVMAQAATPSVAARTRPFFAGEDRLAEMFPDEHRESVEALEQLLIPPLAELSAPARPSPSSKAPAVSRVKVRHDAEAIYRLTFATLHDHLAGREKPTPSTVEHLVKFIFRGLGNGR